VVFVRPPTAPELRAVEDKQLPGSKGWDASRLHAHERHSHRRSSRRADPHSAGRISSQSRLRDGIHGRLHTRSNSPNTIAAPETRRATSALHPGLCSPHGSQPKLG
jgi:hypothetical protein